MGSLPRRDLVRAASIGAVVVAASLCNAAPIETVALEGRRLFNDASLGTTGLACATCHADFDEKALPDGLIRPGHQLPGVSKRTASVGWGFTGEGAIAKAMGACTGHFLRGKGVPGTDFDPAAELSAEQTGALIAYLDAVATGSEPLTLDAGRIAGAEDLGMASQAIATLTGDGARGRTLFFAACNSCHPAGAAGIGKSVVESKFAGTGLARYVRNGGRVMPWFTSDRLTDQDVADILAFIQTLKGQ